MKTLDEVIKACEETVSDVDRGVDIEGCFLGATETRDALHYLKVLQKMQKAQPVTNGECNELYNSPLTWDELKSMGGKPVWVEYSGYTPNWEIVENTGAVRGSTGDFTGRFVETNMSILRKEEQGITWQAYRKERDE